MAHVSWKPDRYSVLHDMACNRCQVKAFQFRHFRVLCFFFKAQKIFCRLRKFCKFFIWQQPCSCYFHISVNYKHIDKIISSKELIVISVDHRKTLMYSSPLPYFSFMCSGQILVKPKQAPLSWEQTNGSRSCSQTVRLLIGRRLACSNIDTFLRSFYATVTAVSISILFLCYSCS